MVLYMSAPAFTSKPSYNISGILFQPPDMSRETLNKSYRIVLEKDEDGRVVVRSPDLQGVVTDGADENEAIKNAFEAWEAILGLEMGFNLIITHKHSV
jgi:predicted RNase H-like HicB family nuclease